jgi:hypothetical protein
MNRAARFVLREGLLQGVTALAMAGATATLIAISAGSRADYAGRLAAGAVVIFALGLVLGSARTIGLTTLPMLGAALAAPATAGSPMWLRSMIIGILWYIASELAWDAIERRDGAKRSATLDFRRAFEVSTVATVALAITAAGFVASNLAPTRTLLSVGFVIGGLYVGLSLATRHVGDAGPDPESPGRLPTGSRGGRLSP